MDHNNKEENKGHDPGREHRFDELMGKHLVRKISIEEDRELRQLVESGFEARFKDWIDRHYADSRGAALPGKVRKKVLANILGDSAVRPVGGWRRYWSWAAALVAGLIFAGWFTLKYDNSLQKENGDVGAGQVLSTDRVAVRDKQFFHLPDGSSVLMNEGSEVTYDPDAFATGRREVVLSGEAFFDIAHDPARPFLVKTGVVTTKVLGTAFNVRADGKSVQVTVTRGLVEVEGKTGVYGRVRPDQRFTVDVRTLEHLSEQVDVKQAVAWKNQHLIFDNIDLREVSRMIRAHYGSEVIFTEKEVLGCRVSASFLNGEDLSLVIRVLSEMMGATYRMDGNKVIVSGGSC